MTQARSLGGGVPHHELPSLLHSPSLRGGSLVAGGVPPHKAHVPVLLPAHRQEKRLCSESPCEESCVPVLLPVQVGEAAVGRVSLKGGLRVASRTCRRVREGEERLGKGVTSW